MDAPSTAGSGRPERALSAVELDAIVSDASTLAERCAGEVVPTGENQAAAAKRLECWKRFAADSDEAAFRSVLGTFGLRDVPDEQLLRLLGGVQCPPGSNLPRWAALLQEIVPAVSAAFSTNQKSCRHSSVGTTRSIPFAQLYTPIVAMARQKVEMIAPRQVDRILGGAWKGLEIYLMARLAGICSVALQPRFLAFKAVRRFRLVPLRFENHSSKLEGEANASLFQAFLNQQGSQGLIDFFLEYPVAARLVAQVTLFWIDFVAEFLGRLETDADAISARFVDGRPLGKIIRTTAGISDPHRGGRSVLVLDFEGGLRLVYKPRPMQIDAAFSELLSWLNARGLQPPLRSLGVLVRGGYGWEEFVEHTPCRNRRESRQFYQRAGTLLCLVHALSGIDIHRENMIATAGGPVIVDLEALCHPAMPEPAVPDEEKRRMDSSVFRIGMLPVPARQSGKARPRDLSALGAPILLPSSSDDVSWKKLNSDEMEAVRGSSRLVCKTHRPRLHGRLLLVHRHTEDLVAGYRQVARLLRSNEAIRREWRARVTSMDRMETRLIKRPTFIYTATIHRSLQPRLLLSGVDRSIELQALPSLPGDDAVRDAEIVALELLDVPAFLKVLGEAAAPGVSRPDVDADLEAQVAAIRASSTGGRSGVHQDS